MLLRILITASLRSISLFRSVYSFYILTYSWTDGTLVEMKIGFIGTGGTGKTTTVNLLTDLTETLNLPYVKSTPRGVFQEFGIVETDQAKLSLDMVWKIQRRMFDLKLEMDRQYPNGIFDRTSIDHLAYCYYRAAGAMPDDVAENMEKSVVENMAQYDLVCYFPMLPFDGNDGLRETGYAYRATIDAIMLGLLHKFAIPYHIVAPGTPEERASQVRGFIYEKEFPL